MGSVSFRGRSPEAKRAASIFMKQEIIRRRRENPSRYFVPNGAQERIIEAVKKHRAWVFILAAANSVGKSAIVINMLVNIIFGSQNRFYDGSTGARKSPFEHWPYPKKFWYVSEYKALENFVVGTDEGQESEIRKWFPRGSYRLTKDKQSYFSSMTIEEAGWRGRFLSYDMDMTQFEADKIGVLIFDEPPPRNIWSACMSRLTLGGLVFMPMTPLHHSAWIKDELVDKAESGDEDIFVFQADMEENCKVHGIRGRLDHAQIERICSSFTEEEKEARAHGAFAHVTGRVYKLLHPEANRHDVPAYKFKQDDYLIFNVVDPHDARPPAVGWFAVDRSGRPFVVDEYPDWGTYHKMDDFRGTIDDVAFDIKRKETEAGWDPHKIVRVMDPNFGKKRDQAVGKIIKEVYRASGEKIGWPLRYSTRVNDEIISGHEVVRNYISPKEEDGPRLRIGESCTNFWYQMTHYSYKRETDKRMQEDGSRELVQKKYKDFPDLVRYFLMYLRKAPAVTPVPNVPWWYAIYDYLIEAEPNEDDWRNPYL